MAFEFTPSEEQRMLVDTVRQFMAQEIFPHEREAERLAEVPSIRGRQIQMRAIAGDRHPVAKLFASEMAARVTRRDGADG